VEGRTNTNLNITVINDSGTLLLLAKCTNGHGRIMMYQ
jgi:hypothetical protein